MTQEWLGDSAAVALAQEHIQAREATVEHEHGEERNRRTETTVKQIDWTVPGGSMTLPYMAVQETVSERWCEVCGDWVTARGIMGALLCVECGTTWDERDRE